MQSFIKQANAFSSARKPFFFLIDFEQKQPVLLPLAECSSHQIFFQFPTCNNVSFSDFDKQFEFSRRPLKFDRYQTAFELVKNEIQNDDKLEHELSSCIRDRENTLNTEFNDDEPNKGWEPEL